MTTHVDEHSLHAVYAPSSADRWAEKDGCSASAEAIAAIKQVVPDESGEEAQKGTDAHSEMERVLAPIATGQPYTAADLATLDGTDNVGVALMVSFVRQLPPGRLWIEQRVALTDQIWGRADAIHWHDESATVTVPDLKDGFVGVDADTLQLLIYAAAAIYTFKLPAKWIRTAIVQPNDFRPGVPRVKQKIYSADQLFAEAQRIAAIPLSPKKFKAGESCTYCAAFGLCEASKDLLAQVGALIAGLMRPDQVTPAQRALFLSCQKPIADAFKNALKPWTKEALNGTIPDGMKLVTGDKRRAWKDEATARAKIIAAKGVDALELPTPARAEEMGIDITGLADKPEGGPVLAFASDTRKPWKTRSVAEMFGSLKGSDK